MRGAGTPQCNNKQPSAFRQGEDSYSFTVFTVMEVIAVVNVVNLKITSVARTARIIIFLILRATIYEG